MPQRITELHMIMPIANLASVMQHGILCHERAARLPHADVSMQAVQERRDKVRVPNGLRLHQYVNLYFHARNPMLYSRLEQVNGLCILHINKNILQIPGTVITDQNASSNYVRFFPPSDVHMLELDQIYAEDWRHEDRVRYWRHKSQKCAEVLVPHTVRTDYILGAYVVSQAVQRRVISTEFPLPVTINPHLFFQ